MPKVVQLPRRRKPEPQDRPLRRSMILPDTFEESESLATVQRWLDMADAVFEQNRIAVSKRTA